MIFPFIFFLIWFIIKTMFLRHKEIAVQVAFSITDYHYEDQVLMWLLII